MSVFKIHNKGTFILLYGKWSYFKVLLPLPKKLSHNRLLEVTLRRFVFPPNAKTKKKSGTDNRQSIGTVWRLMSDVWHSLTISDISLLVWQHGHAHHSFKQFIVYQPCTLSVLIFHCFFVKWFKIYMIAYDLWLLVIWNFSDVDMDVEEALDLAKSTRVRIMVPYSFSYSFKNMAALKLLHV